MNKTAKNTAIYFVGTIVMGVLGFMNTMLLTRVLDERTYAMYGLLHNFVTTIAMLISLGYDAAYSRFYYQHNVSPKRFLLKVLAIPTALFAIVALALLEPNQWIVGYIFEEKFTYWVLFALLGYVFFTFIHRFTQLTARMEGRAFHYVSSNFVGRFGFVGFVFAAFYTWRYVGFDWVLVFSLIGSVLATLINVWLLVRLTADTSRERRPVGHKEMLGYGFPIMLNNLLILVMPLIEKLIVRELAGWQVLGIYTAAAVFQTVVMLLINMIDNIWNPLVFKHGDDEKKFKPIMHNFGLVVSVIVIVGFSLCVLLRRWLVLLLDRNYFDVYIIAPAICFGACFRLVSMIYSAGIHISKKTIHFVIEPIIQLVLSLVLCVLLCKPFGLIGVGIAVTVSVMGSRIYRMAVGLRLYDTGVSEYKMWILMGLCTAVAFASLFFTSFLADAVMSAALIAAMLLILNKDLLVVIHTAKTLLIPKKKTEEN